MTKKQTIIISILLMASAIFINLLSDSSSYPKNELIGFFSGIVFGAGLVIFFQSIFKKTNF